MRREKEIAFLEITPQDKIVDIGTGTGTNLLPFVKAFPYTSFIAEDIDSSYCNLTLLQKTNRKMNLQLSLDSFIIQIGSEKSTNLESKEFTKILAFDVIHEITFKEEMFSDFKRILKDDGKLFIDEILVHEKVKKDRVCNYPYLTEVELKSLLAANGFNITSELVVYDTGHNKFIKIFECIVKN